MPRTIFAAAPSWSGIRHRFLTLNQAKSFADFHGYRLCYLWGVSRGVSFCRFEDLLESIPGVAVVNVGERDLDDIESRSRRSHAVRFRGRELSTYRPGGPIVDAMLAFDLWGDLGASTALAKMVPVSRRSARASARPNSEIARTARRHVQAHDLTRRIGLRVRVTETMTDTRRPRRVLRELDRAITSVTALPWYLPVFVVTDAEYVQDMLTSHFHDANFIRKSFGESERTGRYVSRTDRGAMRTYLSEVLCLSACKLVLNVGGFLNDDEMAAPILTPPLGRAQICAICSRFVQGS
jgi:hypothetical protein